MLWGFKKNCAILGAAVFWLQLADWARRELLLRLTSVVGAKGFGPSRLKSEREAGSRSLWEAERIPWIGKSFQLGKRSAEWLEIVYLRRIDLWLSVWANWLMAGWGSTFPFGCFANWKLLGDFAAACQAGHTSREREKKCISTPLDWLYI